MTTQADDLAVVLIIFIIGNYGYYLCYIFIINTHKLSSFASCLLMLNKVLI